MSTLRVDNIKSRTGSVVTVPETNTLAVTGIVSVTSSGSITNAGNLTNTGDVNVTGSLNVTGGGNFNSPSGIITAGTLNVGTFAPTSLDVIGNATVGGNLTVNGTTTTLDTVNLVVEDKNIGIGTTTTPSNTTADGGGLTIFGGSDGDKTLTWNNGTPKYWALGGGYLQVPGLDISSLMREGVNITSGKLSDNLNIDLENGMVHYFTTTETTTSTPNIRYNASTSLASVMNVGEAVSVTLMTNAATAGYSAQLTIDGGVVTEEWSGGSAPTTGGSAGIDIHTYTIVKINNTGTVNTDFLVLATYTNFD